MSEIELANPPKSDIIPISEIPHWTLKIGDFEGPKVFLGAVKDVCKHIEAANINVYYVLGVHSWKEDKSPYKLHEEIKLFKVTKSMAFRSVTPADPKSLKLEKIDNTVTFTLPRLPWELLSKCDQFFRRVHEEIGTEATVMLTYDNAFRQSEDPGQGWGVLIPKQENTAVNCKYDPSSVVANISNETTSIVGTIHSHPEMSAYASGTDHADQSEEDGIHITFGWKKGGPTEYHIELAIDKRNWTLTPEQVFAQAPSLPPQAEVEEWVKKVEKKAITAIGSKTSAGSSSTWTGSSYTTPATRPANSKFKASYYPSDGPPLATNIVLGVISSLENSSFDLTCPFCMVVLTDPEVDVDNQCLLCENLVVRPDFSEMSDVSGLHDKSIIKTELLNKDDEVILWIPADPKIRREDDFIVLRPGSAKKP